MINSIAAFLMHLLFAMSMYFVVWLVWCWAAPQVWVSGPENIINPSFWLFFACVWLFGIFKKMVFGRSI